MFALLVRTQGLCCIAAKESCLGAFCVFFYEFVLLDCYKKYIWKCCVFIVTFSNLLFDKIYNDCLYVIILFISHSLPSPKLFLFIIPYFSLIMMCCYNIFCNNPYLHILKTCTCMLIFKKHCFLSTLTPKFLETCCELIGKLAKSHYTHSPKTKSSLFLIY
ncbi:Protein of unknown function [Gryllus bimaculatus]|nr:Protein of unknown function [Gryllus bimaculatus]